MTHLLNCPVCGYKEIADNTCPNCDADFSLIRSLTELPPSIPSVGADFNNISVDKQNNSLNPPLRFLLILMLGICLGAVGSFLFLQPQLISNKVNYPSPVVINNDKTPSAIAPLPVNRLQQHEQTYYKVKPGDSLSKIAERFYRDGTLWTSLVKANPNIKGREDFLEIGEPLIIPNREEACRGNF